MPVGVNNPGDERFAVRQLVPDSRAFPARCPIDAWRIDTAGLLPTLAAHTGATVTLEVALRAKAPRTCEGVTVHFELTVEGVPA
jgi:hypothetical protein